MASDMEARVGTSESLLERVLETERLRTDWLMSQNASALVRIEAKLTVIEVHLTRRATPEQVLKLAVGLGLPLLVLLLTGNVELARRFLGF